MLASVQLAAFDVDGVLTDGRYLLDAEGRDLAWFHVRDGTGMHLLMTRGIKVAFISGRSSAVAEERARVLGVRQVYTGVRDKAAVLKSVCREERVPPDRALFLGDDVQDLPAMEVAGVAAAVADAVPEVLARADLITETPGGEGAAREVAERLLKARGSWAAAIACFTQGRRES